MVYARALSLCFVEALLALLPVTRADYYIDDMDPVVQYNPLTTSSSFGWTHVGSDQAYDGTISHGFCNTPDHCSVQIPFNGSGIIIYGFLYGDLTVFTVSLDGGMLPSPQTFSLDHNASANVTLYNFQSLPLAPHTLTISLVSLNDAPTTIYFDYASVNTTAPAPDSSPTVSPSSPVSPSPVSSLSAIPSPPAVSSSPTQSTSFHSHFPIGAVVGSLAGLAVIGIILALLYLWRRRRRHMPVLSEIDPDLHHDSEYQSSSAPTQTMAYTPFVSPLDVTSPLYPNRPSNSMPEQHNTITRITSPSIADSLTSPVPPTSTADSTELYQSIPSTKKSPDDDVTSTQVPASLSGSSGRNQLTDAQADFVNSLYTHDVPAPAIARIVQRMMAGQEIDDVSTVADSHDVRHGDPTAPVAPPSYSES